ncbi:MAG: hypothetical protein ACOC71_02335 [Hyphomicrobiales bacterium]
MPATHEKLQLHHRNAAKELQFDTKAYPQLTAETLESSRRNGAPIMLHCGTTAVENHADLRLAESGGP